MTGVGFLVAFAPTLALTGLVTLTAGWLHRRVPSAAPASRR
jgi:hypothetical protein